MSSCNKKQAHIHAHRLQTRICVTFSLLQLVCEKHTYATSFSILICLYIYICTYISTQECLRILINNFIFNFIPFFLADVVFFFERLGRSDDVCADVQHLIKFIVVNIFVAINEYHEREMMREKTR
jgi:hypothetical protein